MKAEPLSFRYRAAGQYRDARAKKVESQGILLVLITMVRSRRSVVTLFLATRTRAE